MSSQLKSRKKKIVWGVITPYFVAFYILPILLMIILGPHRVLSNPGNIAILSLTVVIIFILVYLMSKIPIRLPVYLLSKIPSFYRSKFILASLFLIFVPVSVTFHSNFGAGFRYSGVAITDSGPVAALVTIYRPIFTAFILYLFLNIVSGSKISASTRVLTLAHLGNFVMIMHGAVDVIWATLAVLIVFKGDEARRYLVTSKKLTILGVLRSASIVILTLISLSGIIFFGFANKVGFYEASQIFLNEFFDRVIYYLYYRLVIFTSSLDVVLARGINWDMYANVLHVELENFLYRVSVIFQSPIARPEIEGLNRLNYLEIYKLPILERAGSSPGPIATFAYFPVLPFNLIFCSMYIAAVLKTFSVSIKLLETEKLTSLSLMFLLVVNFAFFHNPVAAFTKIGPELFKTFLFLYALSSAYKLQRFKC